jgi:hypothetical protein
MPSLRVLPLLVLSASLARCGMCEPNRAPEPAASASAALSGSAKGPDGSSPLASASAHRPVHPKPRLACRVIEGVGDARMETGADGGTPVLIEGLLPTTWVDLPAGARFVAKDPQTTRETTFRGPGRVKACVWAQEESWLASGGFESSVGAGESPGAEEWVVTPLGVVRYAAAKLSVDVGARDVHLAVATGGAFLWTPADATVRGGGAPGKTEDGWQRADPGTFVISGAGPTGSQPLTADGARAAVATCSSLGKSAHDLSAALLAGGADGGTVIAQVATRRLARAACAVAGLRLGAVPPTAANSVAIAPLSAQLTEGMAGWNSLPEGPGSPP